MRSTQHPDGPHLNDDQAGATALIGIGTPGVNRLLKFILILYLARLHRLIGAIGLAEFDQRTIEEFFRRLPEELHERVIFAMHAAFANGFANKSPEEVEHPAVAGLWRPRLKQMVEAFTLLQQRRQALSSLPGLVLIFGSLGGHAVVTIEGVARIRERHRRAIIVVCLSIPHSPQVRGWARPMIERLMAAGADLIIVQDDRVDADRDDLGLAYGLAGTLGGSALSNLEFVAGNNLLSGLCPSQGRQGGLLATQLTYASRLPAEQIFAHPRIGAEYAVREDVLQMAMLDGVTTMRDSAEYSSVGFIPAGGQHPQTMRLRSFAGNIDLDSWKAVAREARTSLKDTGQLDYRIESIFFPSREPYPAGPDEALCQLHITEFATAASPAALLDQLFAGESMVPQPVSPVATIWPASPAPSTAGVGAPPTNGRAQELFRIVTNGVVQGR